MLRTTAMRMHARDLIRELVLARRLRWPLRRDASLPFSAPPRTPFYAWARAGRPTLHPASPTSRWWPSTRKSSGLALPAARRHRTHEPSSVDLSAYDRDVVGVYLRFQSD
jgi:hypothetical protein